MKYFIRFFFIIFIIFCSSSAYSENLIVFLDMNKIMLQSKAGKSITSQLEKKHKKSLEKVETTKNKYESKVLLQAVTENTLGETINFPDFTF